MEYKPRDVKRYNNVKVRIFGGEMNTPVNDPTPSQRYQAGFLTYHKLKWERGNVNMCAVFFPWSKEALSRDPIARIKRQEERAKSGKVTDFDTANILGDSHLLLMPRSGALPDLFLENKLFDVSVVKL